MDNKIKNLRSLLNIPKDIRIAQHIYNKFRDYEESYQFVSKFGKQDMKETEGRGIDIFYVDDDEFIKRFLNKE